MIKLINYYLEVESWGRSQPKKFWRHLIIFLTVLVAWCIAKTGFDAVDKLMPIAHYALINAGLYLLLVAICSRFVWRAYVGMERDHDFYNED